MRLICSHARWSRRSLSDQWAALSQLYCCKKTSRHVAVLKREVGTRKTAYATHMRKLKGRAQQGCVVEQDAPVFGRLLAGIDSTRTQHPLNARLTRNRQHCERVRAVGTQALLCTADKDSVDLQTITNHGTTSATLRLLAI